MTKELPLETFPDELLVGLAMLGDVRSFDLLALRYRSAVFRVAQIYANNELAEDIVQDALLIAFKALPSLEEPTRFAAWLYAITRHAAMRLSRRAQNESQRLVALDEVLLQQSTALSRPFTPDKAFETAWVRAAIDELEPDYQLILKLRYYDELSLKRIANFLSLPLSTVKWRLHRAKSLLREKLGPQHRNEDHLKSEERIRHGKRTGIEKTA